MFLADTSEAFRAGGPGRAPPWSLGVAPGLHLAVHGHFYQPPRENPWTENVPVEPSAAPYHDWNERITAEAYRPNTRARIVDDRGPGDGDRERLRAAVVQARSDAGIVARGRPAQVYDLIVDADRRRRTAIVQWYSHMILPLANERDVRTQVRWGLADVTGPWFHAR